MFIRITDLMGQTSYLNLFKVVQVVLSPEGKEAVVYTDAESFIPVSVETAEKIVYASEKIRPPSNFSSN